MFCLALKSWWASGRDQTQLSPTACHLIAWSESELESKGARLAREAERREEGIFFLPKKKSNLVTLFGLAKNNNVLIVNILPIQFQIEAVENDPKLGKRLLVFQENVKEFQNS